MKSVGILAVSTPKNGGAFQYTLSMIESLKKIKEYNLFIYTNQDNNNYDMLGLQIIRLPKFSQFIFNSPFNIFQDVNFLVSPMYSCYLLIARCPFVFTLHDLQDKYLPKNFTIFQRLWRHLINKTLIKLSAAVVCESEYVKKDIIHFFSSNESKVFVIPAPPPPMKRRDSYSSEELMKVKCKYSLPDDYIFYPAQFWLHKNHENLIYAFFEINKIHNNFFLLLTGKKRAEYKKVMSIVDKLSLNKYILHVEYMSQDELGAAYIMAKLVAIPTLFESISIPAYEAFMFKTPVCISNVVALPDQVGDAAILFDPRSVEDMVVSIRRLIEDKPLAIEITKRASSKIKDLNHDNYSKKLESLISAIYK